MAKPLSNKMEWALANPVWAQVLNPIIASPLNSAQVLKNINLVTGTNIINHGLGHDMNGWWITDLQGIADIYRSAPFNDKTLTLTSSANVTVNIGVF